MFRTLYRLFWDGIDRLVAAPQPLRTPADAARAFAALHTWCQRQPPAVLGDHAWQWGCALADIHRPARRDGACPVCQPEEEKIDAI